MTRNLFVINPTAGKRNRSEEIKEEINALNLESADIYITEAPRSATGYVSDYIKAHSGEFINVFSCGGDGTLSEVAEGIYMSNYDECALGIIPIGSGNDFIKSFDIPQEDFRSVKKQIAGAVEYSDILKITDSDGKSKISINIVSVGFDAAVAKGMEKFKKLPFVSGSIAYNLSVIQCVFTKRKNRFDIYFDGEKLGTREEAYLFAIAANGKYYGGGFKAAPLASPESGTLDFIRINSVSIPKFALLIGKFRAGKHIEEAPDIVFHKTGTELKLCAEGFTDVNIDGEIIPMRDPVIKIEPKAIKIIIPR